MPSEGIGPLASCAAIVLLAGILAMLTIGSKEGSSGTIVYSDELWKPSCRKLRPGWLMAFRATAFLYLFGILASDIMMCGFTVFYYYTQWTFLLVLIYFGMAFIISARESARSRFLSRLNGSALLWRDYPQDAEANKNDTVTLQFFWETVYAEPVERASFSGFMMQIVFQVSAGAALLTDVMYWLGCFPILKDIPRTHNFLEINLHGVNLVFLLVDIFLSRMRFPWFRHAYLVLWSVLYVIFQWIMRSYGLEESWPYPFLDSSTQWSPLWYIALYLANIICYAIMCLIVHLKECFLKCGAL